MSDLHQWLRVEVTYTDDFDRHRVSATTSRAVGPGSPCAPANLKAAPGDGQVTLTWEAGCDNGGPIDRYQYRRLDVRKWVRVPGDGSARRQQVTGLTNGEAHTFEVRARNGQGWGPAAQATATPAAAESLPPPPPPPLTVTYEASSYSAQEGGEAATVTVRLSQSASADLTITITIAADDGTEEDDFSHSLGTAKTLSFAAGTTSRTFTVTAETDPDNADEEVTLGFGTPLPEGVSAGSPAGAAVTLADGAPSPPTDVRLRPASTQGHTRLTVSWTPPPEAVSGYEYRIQGSGSPPSAAASPATISGLEPGTGYRVQVRARNRYGSSGWASGSGRTNANRRPDIAGPGEESVPENTTSVGDYTKSDPDGDATRWLELGGTHASRFDFSAGALRFRTAPDYERDPHSYEVTVRATDGYDVTEHEVTVDVIDVSPPPRPDVTVTVPSGNGHEQLDVRWSVSSSGATVTGWKLQYCQTNACGSTTTLTFEAGTANTTLENLRSGTRYSVRVKATSDEGDSPWSPIQRTYTRANTAPVISGPTSESIPENTTAVASYTATDAEGHSISWSLVESNSGLSISSSSGRLSFDNAPDYESGTTAYTVTVKATDSGNPRASSTRGVTVTVTDVEPPSRMTDVRVSVPSSGTGTLNVTWTAPSSGAPITGYTMQYCYYAFRSAEGEAGEPSEEDLETARQAGRCTETTLGNVTSHTLTDLHRNTLYGVRMKATSGEGTGDWSTQRTAITRSAAAKALAEQMALTGLEGFAALAAPNPFNPSTTIYFQVPESENVSLVIYNLAGQVVRTLIPGRTLKAGIHDVYRAGRDEQGRPVAAGVYFYRLTAGDQALVRKMTMLR